LNPLGGDDFGEDGFEVGDALVLLCSFFFFFITLKPIHKVYEP